MKTKCPQCGFLIDFVEHTRSNDLKEIFLLLPTFGRDAKLAWEYCELFGIAPVSVKTKKLLRLLWEIGQIYQLGKFSFQKKNYAISQPGVAEALKTVCNRHFTSPLSNHNYLKQVMISTAEQEAKDRSKESERNLRVKEKNLMAGAHQPDPEKNLTGVREILKNIGGQNG